MKRVIGILLAFVFTASGCSQPFFNSQSIHGCEPGSIIAEDKFVTIGGIGQWITIHGKSCSNPVVLFLHGGPGNPESLLAESMFSSWESDFTIVHWDQRGSGKTYGYNAEPVELTIEQMVSDGIEVAEYLRTFLNKEKVILAGGSWGSVLGIYMSHKRSDMFYAYVSTSQASLPNSLILSYETTLALAKDKADEAAIATLEAIGSPPWQSPRSFGMLRRVQRGFEATMAEPSPSTWRVSSSYTSEEYRESYVAGEDFSYIQYIGINDDGFSKDIDLLSMGLNFKLPIYFIQGAEDLLVTPDLSKKYFDSITAPDKDYFLIENFAHNTNRLSHEALYRVLVEKVLPLTR